METENKPAPKPQRAVLLPDLSVAVNMITEFVLNAGLARDLYGGKENEPQAAYTQIFIKHMNDLQIVLEDNPKWAEELAKWQAQAAEHKAKIEAANGQAGAE